MTWARYGAAPYMAMELIKGRDLGAVVTERGRLPLTLAIDFAFQAAQGLAHAHRARCCPSQCIAGKSAD